MLDYYKYKDVLAFFCKGDLEEGKFALMELQAKHIALADENSILKTQLQEYEDILYISKNLFFDGACYWLITGSIKQGPFCEKCYTNAGLLIRLIDGRNGLRCSMCGSVHRADVLEDDPSAERVVANSGKVLPFFR